MTSRKSYKISSKRKFCGMFFPMVRKGPVGGDGTLRLFVHSGVPARPQSVQDPVSPSPHSKAPPAPSPILPKRGQISINSQISLLNISTIWNWWRETLPSATLKVQNVHNFLIGSVGKTKIFENKSVDF